MNERSFKKVKRKNKIEESWKTSDERGNGEDKEERDEEEK